MAEVNSGEEGGGKGEAEGVGVIVIGVGICEATVIGVVT
jgi:hypothetical protein